MPTYLYETIPANAEDGAHQFELRQGISDAPLAHHPESGLPVRRVISGGLGLLQKRRVSLPDPGPGCGPENCGCGRFS